MLNGWLSPDGVWYPCEHWEHFTLADLLGTAERNMELAGWLKISNGELIYINKDFTQSQIDWLFDKGIKHA